MPQDLFVEADAAVRQSPEYGAGAGEHLPVGTWSGVRYRAAMRFPILTGGWGIATRIVSATLTFYISDHQHVGPRNSSIYVRRCVTTDYWTEAAGTVSCESGFSAANTTQWSDLSGISATDQATFSSGTTPNAAKSVDVTDIVEYYRAAGTSKIVFFFDQVSSSDYTEIWADEKSGYAAHLYIVYESDSPPNAPTLTAPTAGQVVTSTTPTFSWTHSDAQGDPQSNAEVRVYDAAGTTLLYTWPVAGASGSLVAPVALTRGTTYQFEVRTADAVSGFGAYSAKRSFSIKALPVVTISATRKMVFASGAPRLRVEWTCDQAQTHYRVQTAAPVFDSGWIASAAQFYVLSAVALTNGTAVSVTVSVRSDPLPLEGSANRSFTPRYGLTTHRKDLGAAPTGWGSVSVTSTVPTDATLQIEYGSSTSASATPSPLVWYTSLSSVPFARYLFYRAWFIPSASAGPTLDRIDIPTDQTVTLVDKWGTTKDAPGLVAPWRVDPNEYVYGSRALAADVSGAGPFSCYSYGVKVRSGRSYILTGLMRSVGNSGACIQLQDAAGNVLVGGGVTVPVGPMTTDILTTDRDWYTADLRDTYRYKTPVWVATADTTVYVVLKTGGTAGAKAWFDAVKLEESTVATPWSPGAVGATIVDAGGVQVDGSKGGVFRLRGSAGGARDVVEGDVNGLRFGGDTELDSPAADTLRIQKKLTVGSGDANTVLNFALERPWQFEQGGSGASTALVLRTMNPDKSFHIRATDGVENALTVLPRDGSNASRVTLGSKTLFVAGGTAFPPVPVTNEQFYRTDLRLWFFYDGTRWLTTDLFVAQFSPWQGLAATSSSVYAAFAKQAWTGFNIWVERIVLVTFINAGTALSASHKWVATAAGFISGATIWGTVADISSGASSTWREWVDTEGTLLGSDAAVRLTWTKTGTPGDLTGVGTATYRMVAT